MKNVKKSIMIFGAIAIAFLIVSSATAVQQVNSEPIIENIEKISEQEEDNLFFDVDEITDLNEILELIDGEGFIEYFVSDEFINLMNSQAVINIINSNIFMSVFNSNIIQNYIESD